MIYAGAKCSTERVKWSTEVLNIHRKMSNGLRGAKCSTDNVKCSTEVLNGPRPMSNVARRCYMFRGEGKMFHARAKYSTERMKCSP